MNRWRGHPADEGVVAIVTALCLATFLLVVGAFAVDFGNAFARRQNLQTSADLAALAAAAMLPDRAAAIGKARESLCSGKNENQVNGWAASACTGAPAWMTDLDPANGEVTFYGPDTSGDGRYQPAEAATAGTEATAVRIQTPPARVDFGLGSITGASGVDLQRAATAKMGSLTGPGGVQPIPVTPDETGTTCLADAPAAGGGPPGVTIPPGTSDLLVLQVLAGLQATPKVTRIRVGLLVGLPGAIQVTVRAHAWSSAGADLGDQVMGTGSILGPYEFTAPDFPVGSYVYLYASITIGQTTSFTDWVPIDYGGVDDCGNVIIRRNYISEDRSTGSANALALNLQLGIDHAVRPWAQYPAGNPAPVGQGECNTQPGTSVRTAPVVNCLTVDSGLVVGPSHRPYLHPESSPSPPGGLLARGGCPGTGGTVNLNGHPGTDDNDIFQAAFIAGSAAFRAQVEADIRAGLPPTAAQRGALSPKLFLCPRLFTVPLLDAPVVSGAIAPGSYPVRGFAYLYIDATGPDHGITINASRTVTRIQGIVIDPAWFPATASVPLPIGEYLGENLTKQVALVHDIDDPGI